MDKVLQEFERRVRGKEATLQNVAPFLAELRRSGAEDAQMIAVLGLLSASVRLVSLSLAGIEGEAGRTEYSFPNGPRGFSCS